MSPDIFSADEPSFVEPLQRAGEALRNGAGDEIERRLHGFLAEVVKLAPQSSEEAESRSAQNGAPPSDVRRTWKNFSATQMAQPLQYHRPQSLDELVAVIQRAEKEKQTIRAVGSGHSHSDVAVATDFLIDTHGLHEVLTLDTSVLKDGVDTAMLFQTQCGITIHDLNIALEEAGLALPNMGGYTGQTIAGAISTGTHGSGISLGPLASFVESLELVSESGKIYRIEPGNGPTEPAKYRLKFPNVTLVQNDDWFRSVVVSMGCMGVIYSVILRVVPKFWLSETRTLSTWGLVKEELRAGKVLRENRHYEVIVNPYPIKGKHSCLVTKRNLSGRPVNPDYDRAHRIFFSQLLASIPGLGNALKFLFGQWPDLTPNIIAGAMKGLQDDIYTDVSYKVFDLGPANKIRAYASEIALPM
ncbi:MAG: FAD-binding protein, partial [candidate division KSB1 bacterium]